MTSKPTLTLKINKNQYDNKKSSINFLLKYSNLILEGYKRIKDITENYPVREHTVIHFESEPTSTHKNVSHFIKISNLNCFNNKQWSDLTTGEIDLTPEDAKILEDILLGQDPRTLARLEGARQEKEYQEQLDKRFWIAYNSFKTAMTRYWDCITTEHTTTDKYGDEDTYTTGYWRMRNYNRDAQAIRDIIDKHQVTWENGSKRSFERYFKFENIHIATFKLS